MRGRHFKTQFSIREMFRIFRGALVARYEGRNKQTAHVKSRKTGSRR